ncbi:MAG: toprim domain-containing protein [Bacilli bacterium]|jgi:ribonuclease M5
MNDKNLLNCIFVVEGKNDAEKLKKANIPYVVSTEGLSVPRETVKHLQELSKIHEIIILTDPDGPGQRIESLLLKEIPAAKILNVSKKDSVQAAKIGIEKIALNVLKEYIKPYINKRFTTSSDVKYINLLDLGLTGPNSKLKRRKIAKKFSLIASSLKHMYTQIQLLNINYEDLKKALNE